MNVVTTTRKAAVLPVEMSSVLEAAQPVLRYLPYLKHVMLNFPLNIIQEKLRDGITTFEKQAKLTGMPSMKVLTLRYILCAVLDEAVLQSSLSAEWSRCTLLAYFHQDSQGGEKLFTLLDELKCQPAENVESLQFVYLCLSLGFKGKYALKEDGLAQLESVRRQLFHLIQPYQIPVTAAPGEVMKIKQLSWPRLSWRWILIGSVLVVGVCFGVSKYFLHQQTDQVVKQLNQVIVATAIKQGGVK